MAPHPTASPRKQSKPTGFRVGPAHAAKDAYLGKAQKIKSDLIAHAKIKQAYARTLKSEGLSSARLSREAAEDRLAREVNKGKGKGKRVDNRKFGANVSGANEVGREGGMRVFGSGSGGASKGEDKDEMDVDSNSGADNEGQDDPTILLRRKSKGKAPAASPATSTWKTRAANPEPKPSATTSTSTSTKSNGKKPMTAAWGAMAGRTDDTEGGDDGEKESLRELKRRAYGYKPRTSLGAGGDKDVDESRTIESDGKKARTSFLKRSASTGTPSTSRRPESLHALASASGPSSTSQTTPTLSRSNTSIGTGSSAPGTRRTIVSSDGKIKGVLGGRHSSGTGGVAGDGGRNASQGHGIHGHGGPPRLGKRMGVLLEQIKRSRG